MCTLSMTSIDEKFCPSIHSKCPFDIVRDKIQRFRPPLTPRPLALQIHHLFESFFILRLGSVSILDISKLASLCVARKRAAERWIACDCNATLVSVPPARTRGDNVNGMHLDPCHEKTGPTGKGRDRGGRCTPRKFQLFDGEPLSTVQRRGEEEITS